MKLGFNGQLQIHEKMNRNNVLQSNQRINHQFLFNICTWVFVTNVHDFLVFDIL
jgi:hypothetical protein